jgi:hypothetical protein
MAKLEFTRKISKALQKELTPMVNVNDGECRWMNQASISSPQAERNWIALDIESNEWDRSLFMLTERICALEKASWQGMEFYNLACQQGEAQFMYSPEEYIKQLERQEAAGRITTVNQRRLDCLRDGITKYIPMVNEISDLKQKRADMARQKKKWFDEKVREAKIAAMQAQAADESVAQIFGQAHAEGAKAALDGALEKVREMSKEEIEKAVVAQMGKMVSK